MKLIGTKRKIRSGRQTAMYVSRVSIAINLVLSAFKLFAGVAAHSGAMISDGIHTASDVLSTLIVMAGVAMADRQSDKEHPYGHERMECVAAVLLAAVLFATGAGVGMEAVKTVVVQRAGVLAVPGRLALIAAVVSIVVKEWMYWYTRAAARKIDSQALMADAWHHRSDALSSVGAGGNRRGQDGDRGVGPGGQPGDLYLYCESRGGDFPGRGGPDGG